MAKRPAAVTDLAKARNMGDLSENGYYKAARFKLSDIDRRLRQLKHMLRYAKIAEKSQSSVVEVGSTVIVTDGSTEKTYHIVGGHESNPKEQKLSHYSPIGKALLGKKAGDTITISIPAGDITLTIKTIQ